MPDNFFALKIFLAVIIPQTTPIQEVAKPLVIHGLEMVSLVAPRRLSEILIKRYKILDYRSALIGWGV